MLANRCREDYSVNVPSSDPKPVQWTQSPPLFTTTHWSVVLRAGETNSPGAAQALDQLCRAYWYPLYAFVRRKGHSPHDAQDLTQAFFAGCWRRTMSRRLTASAGGSVPSCSPPSPASLTIN